MQQILVHAYSPNIYAWSQHVHLFLPMLVLIEEARCHTHHNLVHAATHGCSSSRRQATLPHNVRIAMWPSHSNTRSPISWDSSATLLLLVAQGLEARHGRWELLGLYAAAGLSAALLSILGQLLFRRKAEARRARVSRR